MKRIIFGLILCLFFINFISAHFVCGEVENINNISASWMNVKIFYSGLEENYSSCEISPQENKYCCDVENIPGKKWNIGDLVFAKVYDREEGYFSEPVSVITTGEGYDILPKMEFKKFVSFYSPLEKLIFSNESLFLLNVSFSFPYDFFEIDKGEGRKLLCENCSNFVGEIEGDFGKNLINLIISADEDSVEESFELTILEGFEFEKEFFCEKCKNGKANSGQEVEFVLRGNLSGFVEDMELKEFIPIDWEIIDSGGGELREYSDSHNLLVWNFSGKDFEKKFKVKSPFILFFPEKYIFRTSLENEILGESEIIIKKFFGFFPFNNQFKIKNNFNHRVLYPKVDFSTPLIYFGSKNLKVVGVYPKQPLENIYFNLEEKQFSEAKNFVKENFNWNIKIIDSYAFDSNLNLNDIEQIFVRYESKVEQDFFFATCGEFFECEFVKLDKKGNFYEGYINASSKLIVFSKN